MKRTIVTTALSACLGVWFGSATLPRPAQASTTTVYGSLPGGFVDGKLDLAFEFRDAKTDRLVGVRKSSATVHEGRYVADTEGGPLPNGLYVVKVKDATGAALQSATFVELQTTTPGTPQTGNVNIDGTLIAGKIGVPIVNSGALINATTTVQSQIAVRGQGPGTGVLGSTTGVSSSAVSGVASAKSGTGSGVIGFNQSPTGFGVRGIGGPGVGVRGQSTAGDKAAVEGIGTFLAGRFESTETSGTGATFKAELFGLTSTGTGPASVGLQSTGEARGGDFFANNVSGIGVTGSAAIGMEGVGGQVGVKGRGVVGVVGTGFTSTGGSFISLAPTGGTGVTGTGSLIGGSFTSSESTGTATRGLETSSTGATYGGDFESVSSTGRGVRGLASATSGLNFGGWFVSSSTSGIGAIGTVPASTGSTIGLEGTVASTAGIGVFGQATATTGSTVGGDFLCASSGGVGIRGRSTATSGSTIGGFFSVSSSNGRGLSVFSNSSSGGVGIGVNTSGSTSAGMTITAGPSSGTAVGLQATVFSALATAVRATNLNTGDKVELGGPKGALFVDGPAVKTYGSQTLPFAPLAFGHVHVNGTTVTVLSGSGNFTALSSVAGKVVLTFNGGQDTTNSSLTVSGFKTTFVLTFTDSNAPNGNEWVVKATDLGTGNPQTLYDFNFVAFDCQPVGAQPIQRVPRP